MTDFNTYSDVAMRRAFYPAKVADLPIYVALALNGEAGEFAEHVKKAWRDDGGLTEARKKLLIKELGDILWYVAAGAQDLGVTLEDVAQANLEKLQGRHERGTLGGSGDER